MWWRAGGEETNHEEVKRVKGREGGWETLGSGELAIAGGGTGGAFGGDIPLCGVMERNGDWTYNRGLLFVDLPGAAPVANHA